MRWLNRPGPPHWNQKRLKTCPWRSIEILRLMKSRPWRKKAPRSLSNWRPSPMIVLRMQMRIFALPSKSPRPRSSHLPKPAPNRQMPLYRSRKRAPALPPRPNSRSRRRPKFQLPWRVSRSRSLPGPMSSIAALLPGRRLQLPWLARLLPCCRRRTRSNLHPRLHYNPQSHPPKRGPLLKERED